MTEIKRRNSDLVEFGVDEYAEEVVEPKKKGKKKEVED